MLFHPKRNEAFKVYADADFTSNWLKEYGEFDPAMAKSNPGWVISQVSNSMGFQDAITDCPQ